MKSLTEKQAFDAMRIFLDGYYDNLPSEGLGRLLSDILPCEDGMPADSAAWDDWKKAVSKVVGD